MFLNGGLRPASPGGVVVGTGLGPGPGGDVLGPHQGIACWRPVIEHGFPRPPSFQQVRVPQDLQMAAKMAETLGRLSGGRLILGLGGGHSDEEFRAFGLGVPSPRQKVDGMAEAIQVIKGLWSQPRFTFGGDLYQTAAADLEPKPAQPIPIWLGTFGERALAVTGRLADGWIPSYGYVPPERLPVMRERVLAAADQAGRDPSRITCALHLQVRVDEHAPATGPVVSGPPEAVAEQLAGFARLGFTVLSLTPAGPGAGQPERLAHEVIPAVTADLS